MISGIRRAINKHSEKIYDAERFVVNRDKNGIYGISANLEALQCKDFQNAEIISFLESPLFIKLSKLD